MLRKCLQEMIIYLKFINRDKKNNFLSKIE